MYANLDDADLSYADLRLANFYGASLRRANISYANLNGAHLVRADLSEASFVNCLIFGMSAWKLKLENTVQKELVISEFDEPVITVDNLEVAQFIYLLLHNEKIREVIDTLTSKVVLILGRFTETRKKILDAIRTELRKFNYSPVLFDFEKPTTRDMTETISILAHIARFVIADLSDAKSLPQELERIVPDLPSVPIIPLLQTGQEEYLMFEHFRKYNWVLPVVNYENIDLFLTNIRREIIDPAETKVKELRDR